MSAGGASSSTSGITVWKWLPLVISASELTASLCRSSDFGVMITSGLRKLRFNCRRSAWK